MNIQKVNIQEAFSKFSDTFSPKIAAELTPTTDSVDMNVYKALRERWGSFEHFVGRMQPVLALARDALRHNLRRDQTDAFLETLNQFAEQVQAYLDQ